jgi:transcriptional regulator with XRE-family HTH domain
MPQNSNVVGRNVSRERYQHGWTQDELVTKMQLLGCYMTRDILASIETRRCIVTDKQIEFFAEAFGFQIQQLFPAVRHFVGKPPEVHEKKDRHRPKANTRLARRRKK